MPQPRRILSFVSTTRRLRQSACRSTRARTGYRASVRLAGTPASVHAQAACSTARRRAAAPHSRHARRCERRRLHGKRIRRSTATRHDRGTLERRPNIARSSPRHDRERRDPAGTRRSTLSSQGTATGLVRLRGANDQALLAAVGAARARLAETRWLSRRPAMPDIAQATA